MKQVRITGPAQFEIAEADEPVAGPGDLLLAPLRVGICATDLEILDGSMVYLKNGFTRLPITPGHEWVARVVGVGDDVTGFSVGDTVVGECSIGCESCEVCAAGDYHRCPDRFETGIVGIPGGMTERMSFPARSAHRVPDGVAIDDAVFVEPMAVSYRALLRLDPKQGSKVLIVGGGTLGYLAAALLRAAFHVDIALAAGRPESQERARRLGVRTPEEGERFPYILEAAGTVSALERCHSALAPGGRLVLIGLTGVPLVPTPLDDVVVNDQEIVGSLGSPHVWPTVLDLLAAGGLRPSELLTATYSLEEFGDALAHLARRDPATGKILIAPN